MTLPFSFFRGCERKTFFIAKCFSVWYDKRKKEWAK